MFQRYIASTVITLAVAIGGYAYWKHQQRYPSTDDAYIQAHLINIAPQISGKVQYVFVKNQQIIQKGQTLFTIDPAPFQIALNQAQANLENTKQAVAAGENAVAAAKAGLAQREAQLIDTQKNYERIMLLAKKGYYAKSGADDATRQLTVAKQAVIAAQNQLAEAQNKLGKTGDKNAQIKAATAAVSQAILNLGYTKIITPAGGQLAQFSLQPGQTVTAYETLFSLVENQAWWVMANIKETHLEKIHIGQKATIYVDMYPNHPFHGYVASISPGSGSSFSLLPPENATGNWVKVTQRIPVRINITDTHAQYPLRIGASCSVTIDAQS
jgi:membrane fusion protein (multidrug efflux system)